MNKVQYIVTIVMGIVYGIIGVVALGVYLDITLLAVALYALYIYLKNFTSLFCLSNSRGDLPSIPD